MPGDLFEGGACFDWSPDGREIVWATLADGRMQLALIEVEADRLARTLPTAGYASDPQFSPDGQWIAYASGSTAHTRGIRLISKAGTADQAVTKPVEFVNGELIPLSQRRWKLEIPLVPLPPTRRGQSVQAPPLCGSMAVAGLARGWTSSTQESSTSPQTVL
jgi:dipeptidyl aminopeptidase/acylaminoacyl peptidase